MDKFRVVFGPITVDDAVHEDGSIIPLTADKAAALIEAGAVELVPLQVKEKPKQP